MHAPCQLYLFLPARAVEETKTLSYVKKKTQVKSTNPIFTTHRHHTRCRYYYCHRLPNILISPAMSHYYIGKTFITALLNIRNNARPPLANQSHTPHSFSLS